MIRKAVIAAAVALLLVPACAQAWAPTNGQATATTRAWGDYGGRAFNWHLTSEPNGEHSRTVTGARDVDHPSQRCYLSVRVQHDYVAQVYYDYCVPLVAA